MSPFQETLENLHALLRGTEKPKDWTSYFKTTPRRLSIYPRFVKGHVMKFLSENFLSLKTLFDEVTWKKILDQYFKEYPPTHWRLFRCAEAFPSFIQNLREQNLYDIQDFHVELSEFEWMEAVIYHEEERIPSISDLQEPLVNPTLTILNTVYPLVQFANVTRSKENSSEEKEWIQNRKYLNRFDQEQIIFLFRNPMTLVLNYCIPTDRMLLAVKIVHEKISLQEVAQAVGENISAIHDALEAAMSQGLLIGAIQK